MKLQGTQRRLPQRQGLRRLPRQDRRREQDHHDRPRADQEMRLGAGRDRGADRPRGQPRAAAVRVRPAQAADRAGRARASIRPIVLVFMAAMSAVLVVQDVLAQRRGRAAPPRSRRRRSPSAPTGWCSRPSPWSAHLHRACCRCSAFASRRRCSSPAFQLVLERPTTPRQWAMLAAVAVGTAAVTYLVFEQLPVGAPAARHAGRAGDPCSNCSAPASSPSCSGSICCPCSWARWRA